LNKTRIVGNNFINTVLYNLQPTADFAGLLVLDIINHTMKKSNIMNEAARAKPTSKE